VFVVVFVGVLVGLLVVGGEVTTSADFDAEKIAKEIYFGIGYTNPIKIISQIAKQSSDIAQGVDIGGAGDQGIMYGYATTENEQYLPNALVWVHQLAKKLETLRKIDPAFAWLGPDGKTQITVENGQ
jgi:S-adenosylmethionine synthetase